MPDDNSRAVMGDNKPTFLDFFKEQNESLPGLLATEHADLLQIAGELKSDFVDAPTVVDSDEVEKTMTDLGGRLAKFLKLAEATRTVDKAPTLQSSRIVDNFFSSLTQIVQPCMSQVERRVNAYKVEKARIAKAERDERERIAREAAAEAQRLAEEAMQHEGEARREAEAEAAQAAARAKAAEKTVAKTVVSTQARTESGAQSVQKTSWTGDIVDLDLLDLNALRPYISVSALEVAVRQYASKFKGERPLEGAKIYEKSHTSFKG